MQLKSVKTKVIALVLCCVILSSIIIGFASILSSRRVVAADSVQIMNQLCENRSQELNSLFQRISQSVDTLAVYATHHLDDIEQFKRSDTYVAQFTESLKDVALNAAQNTEGAITVYIRYNPKFTNAQSGLFYERGPNGKDFVPLTPTNLAQFKPSDREHVGWFYEPIRNKKGTWVSPYFNKNVKLKMVSYVMPFYVDNTFIGIVGMDINFSMLENIVSTTKVYDTGYTFLVEDSGRIVSHKSLSPGTDLTYTKGFHPLAESLKNSSSNGTQLVEYSYEGEKKAAAFQPLVNGMKLVLTAPINEISQQSFILIRRIIAAVLLVIGIAVVATILFTRRLVRPLRELTDAAQKISGGDLSVSITHHSSDEVGILAESFRQTVDHLNEHISFINSLAYRDSMTGVLNTTAYTEAITRMDELIKNKGLQFAVIFFDVNGLKIINDTKGHALGDLLIINASKIIQSVFKDCPLYRIGGDEFALILEGADYQQYPQLLDKLAQEISAFNQKSDRRVDVSMAYGAAEYTESSDKTYNDVFRRADSAMYRNKAEVKAEKE